MTKIPSPGGVVVLRLLVHHKVTPRLPRSRRRIPAVVSSHSLGFPITARRIHARRWRAFLSIIYPKYLWYNTPPALSPSPAKTVCVGCMHNGSGLLAESFALSGPCLGLLWSHPPWDSPFPVSQLSLISCCGHVTPHTPSSHHVGRVHITLVRHALSSRC